MKIKIDFITNSSSTSFTLSSVLTGYLPDAKYEDIKKFFPKGEGYIREDYAHIWWETNDDYDNKGMKHSIYLTREAIYDNVSQEASRYRTIVEIKIDNFYINNEEGRKLNAQLSVEYLEKLLPIIPNANTHLLYFQYPSDMGDGGWNGGDPMGMYTSTPDCFRNETKTGTIYIINNRVTADIFDFGQEESILNDVCKLMNNELIKK